MHKAFNRVCNLQYRSGLRDGLCFDPFLLDCQRDSAGTKEYSIHDRPLLSRADWVILGEHHNYGRGTTLFAWAKWATEMSIKIYAVMKPGGINYSHPNGPNEPGKRFFSLGVIRGVLGQRQLAENSTCDARRHILHWKML